MGAHLVPALAYPSTAVDRPHTHDRPTCPRESMATPHQVTSDQLADVMFWRDVVRRNDDGTRISVADACRRTRPRLSAGAWYYHRRLYTEQFRLAAEAIDELTQDDRILSAARARALAIIEGGTDAAAASLVRSILSAQPHRARDVTLVVEQFGPDDFGGGRLEDPQ